MYSNCITYLVCLFDVFFNKRMTSTMTVTGLILPVLLHCGILEHPHQDFSMQNKLLKVTDRSYSHLKPPKLYISSYEQQTYRKNALNPADLQQKHRVAPQPRAAPACCCYERGRCACQDARAHRDAVSVHVLLLLLQWISN